MKEKIKSNLCKILFPLVFGLTAFFGFYDYAKIAKAEESNNRVAISDSITRKISEEYGSSKSLSKVISYGWEAGLDIVVPYKDEFGDIFNGDKYKGIWLAPFATSHLDDSEVFALSKFIKHGGRAFCEIDDKECKYKPSLVSAFREYFSLSLTCENVKKSKQIYPLTQEILPWAEDLVVKIDANNSLEAFFTTRGDYKTGMIKSEETNTSRAISAYRKMENGEIFFLVAPAYRGLFAPRQIDLYDNKQAVIRILKWLSGK
ncbi:hypothetical protein HZB88_04210 [archaeon]|nr:hypothetical protein [archaeon]